MNTVTQKQYSTAPSAEFPDPRWTVVTESLALQPTADALIREPVSEQLLARHQETQAIAMQHDIRLWFLGYQTAFSGTKVYPGIGHDWVMMNLSEDPLFYTNDNQLIMPRRVKRELNAVLAAGINYDAIFIAHEVPRGSAQTGQSVPLELIMPPPPPGVMHRLGVLNQCVATFWRMVRTTMMAAAAVPLVTGAVGLTVAAGAATAAVAVPAILVDPILLGVQLDHTTLIDGQPLGMWYYLAQWDW